MKGCSMKDFVIKLRALFISNDWKPTYNEEILVKNDCILYLDDKVQPCDRQSFTYDKDNVAEIIKNDFNLNSDIQHKIIAPTRLVDTNTEYHVEKYGWLLSSGKYPKGLPEFGYSSCSDATKKIAEDFVNEINDLAARDYLALRGVKQHKSIVKTLESQLQIVPSNEPIADNCFIQVIQTVPDCSTLVAGKVFKIIYILDSSIVIAATNKKGSLMEKYYEIPGNIFLREASEKNIITVTMKTVSKEVDTEIWKKFAEEDVQTQLPKALIDLITSSEQHDAVYRAYGKGLNFSPLLNDAVVEEAYSKLLVLLEGEYVREALFSNRLRSGMLDVIIRYKLMGLDPERFIDDSYDQISLEEDTAQALNAANQYKNSLIARGVSEELAELAYHYHFRFGKEFTCALSISDRWHYYLPYYLLPSSSESARNSLRDAIKMYAGLYKDSCILKTAYLDAELKSIFLKYFKAPVAFDVQGVTWDEYLLTLLNSNKNISISLDGINILIDNYSIGCDYNSIYVKHLTSTVWRAVFINDSVFVYGMFPDDL